ncbi:hypothetical protein ACI6PS_11695 [Flavobacterium sp. PLA-1-15]|uniref:hypothetical protein n=1 Tax=Flavobacterium sp. PLA-1-15 TaxID=3380533 RepID=UPI003B7B310F
MSKATFLIFYFISQFVFSQNEKLLHGLIVIKDATPQGVHVINLMNEKETVSDSKGVFSILAKPDDLLVFSANHLDYMRKIIEPSDYDSAQIRVEMTSKINELDEVEVRNYSHLNAENLGITNGVKTYTPAERKLQTAGDFKPIHLLQILGGSMPFDPVLNAINGRTKRLKEQIRIEQKEQYLSKLDELYETDFYIKKLKINADYVDGFKYYLLEDDAFVTLLEKSNETQISFSMSQLSVEYNNLISDEKK